MTPERTTIAIVGSRALSACVRPRLYDLVAATDSGTIIVSGGAAGVDTEARRCAAFYRRDVTTIRPKWHTYGNAAGFVRNGEIVRHSTIVVAYWDGVSRGTLDTIRRAIALRRTVIVVRYPEDVEIDPGSVC